MKLAEVSYKPIAHVAVSMEEIDLLCECSAKHYDGVCQDASKPGGFLYGMRNREENAPSALHVLTFRQLDTLAKIAEVGGYLPDREKGAAVFMLGGRIHRILKQLDNAAIASVKMEDGE